MKSHESTDRRMNQQVICLDRVGGGEKCLLFALIPFPVSSFLALCGLCM